jgi:hypothetical protein
MRVSPRSALEDNLEHYKPVQTHYKPVQTHYKPVQTHYKPVQTHYKPVQTHDNALLHGMIKRN